MAIYIKNTTSYNISMKSSLSEWLQKKYIDWMAEQGEIKTQHEFADFLGIDKVSLNRYFNGKIKTPDAETITKISEKLGPEIYDVLGLVRPDPQLQELTSIWHKLDQSVKEEILRVAEDGNKYHVD